MIVDTVPSQIKLKGCLQSDLPELIRMKNAISLLKTSCKHFYKLLMEKLTVVPTVVNHPEIDNLKGSSFNNIYKITSDNKLCQFS